MTPMINLAGQKFGRLLVVSHAGKLGKVASRWNCECECGKSIVTTGIALRTGHTKSCGCFQRQRVSDTMKTHGHGRVGGVPSRAYVAWGNMIQRCDNAAHPSYQHYGGRGIAYDHAWRDFAGFLEDMGEPPAGLELDRIDNEGPYTKTNCRWATRREQMLNTRRSLRYRGGIHAA